jgi:hypothetical protein
MEKIPYEKYILPVGIAVAGYFILKELGVFGGGNAGAANANAMTASTASGAAAALTQAKAQGDIVTLNASQVASLANGIYNAGVASPVDETTIYDSIQQCNTLSDLLSVIQSFGTKQAGGMMCSLFGGFLSDTCGTYDLPSFVRASVDSTTLQAINQYLGGMGINYQF